VRWHSAGVPKSKVYEFDDVSVRRQNVVLVLGGGGG